MYYFTFLYICNKSKHMKLSSRLELFAEPETLKMAKLGRELRSQGIDIIDLSLGEPDFDTPEHIKESLKKAVDDNYSHYTPVAGFPDLREAVCTKLRRDNQLEYKQENILVSTGAKQSLANVVMAIVNKGDEVVIPTPFWVTYSEIVKLAEGNVVLVRTSIENKYKITPAELEAALTEKTTLFMFSSPCNPSGSVYSKEELEGLVAVFRKFPEVFIISDEIYEYINFVGKHESIAQFDDIKDRVIVINGLSKGYAMTGYRLGYIAAHPTIVKACEKLQGQYTSGATAVTQRGAIEALTGDLAPSIAMNVEFTKRRARMLELLKSIPGVEIAEPDGAFYVFPVIKAYFGKKIGDQLIKDADDLCMYLLNTAHVSTVTGRAFGEPDCIRISFANSMGKIEEAMARITKAMLDLS
jgi:aspartate aminotransferase